MVMLQKKAENQQKALRETGPELPPTQFLWKNTVAGKADNCVKSETGFLGRVLLGTVLLD